MTTTAMTVPALVAELAALRADFTAFVDAASAAVPRLAAERKERDRGAMYARFAGLRGLPATELLAAVRAMPGRERIAFVESTSAPAMLAIAREASDTDRLAWLALLPTVQNGRIRFELSDGPPPLVKLTGNASMFAESRGPWAARSYSPGDVIEAAEWVDRTGGLDVTFTSPRRNGTLAAVPLPEADARVTLFERWRSAAVIDIADAPSLPGEAEPAEPDPDEFEGHEPEHAGNTHP